MNVDKINLAEAFNNDNGKTSANKLVGVITSFVCMLLVLSLVIFYFFNTGEATVVLALIDKTVMYFGCAAGLMGVKSVSSAIWRKNSYTPPQIKTPEHTIPENNTEDKAETEPEVIEESNEDSK